MAGAASATPHRLLVFVCVWYLTAAVTVTSSKAILERISAPYLLSTVQFAVAALLLGAGLRCNAFSALAHVRDSTAATTAAAPPTSTPTATTAAVYALGGAGSAEEEGKGRQGTGVTLAGAGGTAESGANAVTTRSAVTWRNVLDVAVVNALGFLLTNIAIGLCRASFAETVKSAEPITSIALGALWLAMRVSVLDVLSVCTISSGVALTSIEESTFSLTGFAAAMGSNVMFSSRGILVKRKRGLFRSALDSVHLYYWLCVVGAVGVGIASLCFDARRVWTCFTDTTLAGDRMRSDGQCGPTAAAATDGTFNDPAFLQSLLLLFLVNGTCYCIYNQMSLIILSQVSYLTHATLNVFRRVFIVLVAFVVFRQTPNLRHVFGVALAVGGMLLYVHSANLRRKQTISPYR